MICGVCYGPIKDGEASKSSHHYGEIHDTCHDGEISLGKDTT